MTGISIMTGVYADVLEDEDPDLLQELRAEFEIINQLLRQQGYPEHLEPENAPSMIGPGGEKLSNESLTCLQRAMACLIAGEPIRNGVSTREDVLFTREVRDSSGRHSHLLNHFTYSGFYVPVDFETPIKNDRLRDRYVGSSQRLERELRALAPLIGLEWNGNLPSRELIDEWADEWESHPHSLERNAWAHLWAGVQVSLEHGCAIELSA
jgi:hypothetical protein